MDSGAGRYKYTDMDIFPITIEFLLEERGNFWPRLMTGKIISHGTVPKIFHFINRTRGNNRGWETFALAASLVVICIRVHQNYTPRRYTLLRPREDRGGSEFMRPAFIHRAIKRATPVIPFV